MSSRAPTSIALAVFASVVLLWQTSARAQPNEDPSAWIDLRDVPHEARHRSFVDHAVPFLHGVQLDDAAMYRLAGREDLARKYEAQTHAANVLALTGIAGLISGSIVALTAPSHKVCAPGYATCRNEVTTAQGKIGISIAALMPLLGGIALAVLPTPLSPEQKTKMAEDYNSVRPAPVVVPGGAGLELRGTF